MHLFLVWLVSYHVYKFDAPHFLLTNSIKTQRDSHKIVIQLIGPDSSVLLLHMNYAENYLDIQQIMIQQKWFKYLGSFVFHTAYHLHDPS